MKTSGSIFTKTVLGLLIAGSMAACNNNKAGSAPATTTTAASPGTETTAYVQSDTLISKYEYAKDMSKRLQDKGKTAQADVGAKQEALQREYVEYQKDAATMPADKRQTTEQRLQREKQEFDQYQQRAGAEFQNAQGTETNKLYDKLTEFCKAYAKEKGYKAILTYSRTNPSVLYVDPSLDITAEVVKKLNDAYAKDKK